MKWRVSSAGVLGWAAVALACAGPPSAPPPDRSAAWGYLRLVPREGAPAARTGSYGDRRMRLVELVDYSRPGFAVVYTDGHPRSSNAETRLSIRDGRAGTRIEPANAAASAGGRVLIANDSARLRVVSCPATGSIREVHPGGTVSIELTRPGEYSVFLLGVPEAVTTVFAAPGAWAVVAESGHWQLEDLEPGRREIRTWHPRLPPTSQWIELSAGGVHRLDLEVGVGRSHAEGAHVE